MIKIVDRIVLIGTSHVAENSIKEIEDTITKYAPEVVALELDTPRFRALMSEGDDKKKAKKSYSAISELGAFGYVFARVAGYVQKKVGTKLGVDPGVDMKGAYIFARDNKIPVALIDINIKVTLKKMSKLSFFKKLSLFGSIMRPAKKEEKDLLDFDLKSVPDEDVVIKMIEVLEKRTPDLYKILIDDRNKYMAKKLMTLKDKHEGIIIAVMGAGHVEGISKILNENLFKNSSSQISYSYVVDSDNI
ncbi:MAG: TraB/GumN family protein [Candidatus Woesearchaeota archaeon]|jgi:pheromone shutdown-related protein TraB|nr:TraB/GumN family protein [Candidatus Woesearchaeota archaeon]